MFNPKNLPPGWSYLVRSLDEGEDLAQVAVQQGEPPYTTFVHLHTDPILNELGQTVGFRKSIRYLGHELDEAWDAAMAEVA